jgi:hypothetical protein
VHDVLAFVHDVLVRWESWLGWLGAIGLVVAEPAARKWEWAKRWWVRIPTYVAAILLLAVAPCVVGGGLIRGLHETSARNLRLTADSTRAAAQLAEERARSGAMLHEVDSLRIALQRYSSKNLDYIALSNRLSAFAVEIDTVLDAFRSSKSVDYVRLNTWNDRVEHYLLTCGLPRSFDDEFKTTFDLPYAVMQDAHSLSMDDLRARSKLLRKWVEELRMR